MSRVLKATKRRRVPYRSKVTAYGLMLPARLIPMNTRNGAADVPYDGPAVLTLPIGTEITISNRSGDRKKVN